MKGDQQKLMKDQQTLINAIIDHLSKIDTLDNNVNKIAKLLNIDNKQSKKSVSYVDTKNDMLDFKDEVLKNIKRMRETREKSQKIVNIADTIKESENKKAPKTNAWVQHLKKIKDILFINQKDAMIIATDPNSEYYYKTDRVKKEKKAKKEKKVHICDLCKKQLYDKSGLNRHIKVHRLEISSLRGQIKRQSGLINSKNLELKKVAIQALPELKERLEKLLDYFRKIEATKTKENTEVKEDVPKIEVKKNVKKTKNISTPPPFKITQKFISQINSAYKEISDDELGLTSDMIKGTEYINGNVTFNVEGLIVDEVEKIDKITIVDDPEKDDIYTIELNQIIDNGDIVVYEEFEVDKD